MNLVAQNISLKVDGQDWLHSFSLTLKPGSFTTVIGATRAGKTSLLRVLAGLAHPTSGQLLVGDTDVTGINVRQRNVGMVYQEFVNYPRKTVFENIAAPLRNAGESTDFITRRIKEVADLVGLSSLLARYPLELSGGQQQRLAIARTIARPRQLVLLDEPLVNLDYKLREHLRGEFSRIFAGSETIAVYASSEPREALILNGDVVVISQGRICQHGRAEAVYACPQSITVARQISDPPMSIVPAQLTSNRTNRVWVVDGIEIGSEHGRAAPLADGNYSLGIYPHHLGLDQTKPGVRTLVDFVEVSGSNSFIYARHSEHVLAIKEKGVRDHAIGDALTVNIDPSTSLVFGGDGALVAGRSGEPHNG